MKRGSGRFSTVTFSQPSKDRDLTPESCGLLASGETRESILKSCIYLESEGIQEALNYAAFLADEQVVEFAS